jgi:hypothetical protein
MEILKGTVIQAKKLDNFEAKGKKYYPWGILIKDTANKTYKGQYYCLEETQDVFVEGKEVFFTYKKHKEAAKSAISPAVDPNKGKAIPEPKKSVKTSVNAPVDNFIRGKLADNVSFAASYAKDIVVAKTAKGEKPEGLFPIIANEIYEWTKSKLEEL